MLITTKLSKNNVVFVLQKIFTHRVSTRWWLTSILSKGLQQEQKVLESMHMNSKVKSLFKIGSDEVVRNSPWSSGEFWYKFIYSWENKGRK